MPLRPESGTSNMYEWVDAKWNPIGGRCPHRCVYCYVPKMPYTEKKYGGELTLMEHELKTDLYDCPGKTAPLTVFVCNMTDLFADAVPREWIDRILEHCNRYPANTYLLQTKNPRRLLDFMAPVDGRTDSLPKNTIIGTTLETNRDTQYDVSQAPNPYDRYHDMLLIKRRMKDAVKYMVTVEPVLDFDPDELASWINELRPDWVNIGADSKGCGLEEPSRDKIWELLRKIRGFEVKKKRNLRRILT